MNTTEAPPVERGRRSWTRPMEPDGPAAGSATRRPELTPKQFEWIARTVFDYCGIHLPPAKHQSVEGRLGPRVRELRLAGLAAYLDYLRSPEGRKQEFIHFIDAITINKTEFFREAGHYAVLTDRVLPELATTHNIGTRYPVRLWSAGCSSGEEPYTLAMVLNEYGEAHPPFSFSILATDVSQRMLDRASKAVYPLESFAPVPEPLRRKYLMRNRNPEVDDGRITPEIRRMIEFRRLNLMDRDPRTGGPLDIVFCRNVMIYFTKEVREDLISRLVNRLRVGGYLFVGHSETLNTMQLPVVTVGPTVFRKVA